MESDVHNLSEISSKLSSINNRSKNYSKERNFVSKDDEIVYTITDSSENSSMKETSQNQNFLNEQNATEEIIINSSSNTSGKN
jgi:hypothetical protein